MAELSHMDVIDTALEDESPDPADNNPETMLNEVHNHWFAFKSSNHHTAGELRYNDRGTCASKFQLERDVHSLQQQLQEEKTLHAVLEHAMEKKLVKWSCPSHFLERTIKLLSSIVTLEATVSILEEEMVSLRYQLSQERNEIRLAEYRLQHAHSKKTCSHSSKGDWFLQKCTLSMVGQ